MKVTLLSENLQKKLSLANHAISSRNQLPILAHVLLETKEGKLSLSSTDLEIGIETTVPCQVDEDGATTVPAKLFLEIVNSLPQDKIILETKDGTLHIISKRTKSVLQTTPKDEFPMLYSEKGEKLLTFVKGSFKEIFSKVVFASSVEATRPALSGVLVKKTHNGFVVVATDGYRLSLDEVKQNEEAQLQKPVIIPSRLIKEATNLSEGGDVTMYISEKNNQLLFEQEETVLVGRVIEGEFPHYEKVVPTDVATKAFFDREEMQKAVKLCAIFARETANIITLSLLKDKIVVAAKTPSLGENTVEVEARLEGEENEIAFNVRYIVEALSNIPDNDMAFEMTGPLNPGVFKIVSKPEFLHLIMPIRI
ncbi:MAG TPA: DNA polymerase III subunit beta [Candidatus Saccharimonadales bacterium]|nr:DNA polymerase III subunit beta [Candidatus Saccharimonadales bacterium]